MSARARWVAVVALLAAAVGASALPPWVTAAGASALTGEVAVRVTGGTAAPAVPATALVLAAAAAATALAGRVGRWLVAALTLAGGLVVAVSAAAVLADPSAPALAVVAARTGVDHLAGPATATAAPWLAVALGAATVAAAVGLARSSGRWPAPSRRHEAPSAPAGPDERSDWDALSRGGDPSEGTEPPAR